MLQGIRRITAVRNNSAISKLGPEYKQFHLRSPDINKAKAYLKHSKQVEEHSSKTASLWLKISLFVAVPSIILCGINTYKIEMKHAEHREHLAHIKDEDWPKNREYQNIRSKKFFWGDGDKTLFWNDAINRNPKN